MECCYPVDCGEYAVSPRLVPAAYCPRKHCEPEPFIPRLPHCHKPKHYCTEKPEKMYCEKPKYYCTEKPEKMYCEKPKYYCFEKPEKMYCEKPKYYCIEKPHKSYCEKPNYYCIEKPHKSYCEKPQYCCIEKPHKSYCEKPQYCCIEKPHKSYSEKPKYYCTEKPVKCYAPQYVCCEPPPPRHKVCPVPDPCCHQQHYCKPVKTKYIMPCYRYEDGRVVRKFPVSAFKRNGLQDVEHSIQGTANFLERFPRDVVIECGEVHERCVKVADPAKVPPYCCKNPLGCSSLKKKPVKIKLEELLDDDC